MKSANESALFTDLYELTMLQAYFEQGMTEEAVLSLFVRRLPPRRNFLLACGRHRCPKRSLWKRSS